MNTLNDVKPVVVVSKCLGFAKCRYNGITLPNEKVDLLAPFVEYRPVCPEVEIGLGVPREPIRVVNIDDVYHLYQPATQRDITGDMQHFADSFLDSVGEVDGFILKDRSPSCGIKDVRVYHPNGMPMGGGANGFFGTAVTERYPLYPIETEGRMSNFTIREHFFTKLFTFARFRLVKKTQAMNELVGFHARNKFLLMSYSETIMRKLGRIVANHEKKPVADVFDDYEQLLRQAFVKVPRFTSNINVLFHVLGFVSDDMNTGEKAYFLECIEKYRNNKVPLSVPVSVIRSYIVGNDIKYLLEQTFFEPFPEDLIEITDSGKGRKMK